ncbi:purine transporter [Pseudovirgaria hyperparasitica]|uniref:Purine transporter n=1 Tax=Pseudovirgaria hyperparasitica TaxID=470096 RepID=A0A6A6WL48_9PEZI|nr:purine transporter [Pseudovirgaria hyperparasitica]KAF2762908.1 purine transporter [Pseudovirgaria hyperparasitica]
MTVLERFADSLNHAVAQSPVGYYFHLEGSAHPHSFAGSKFTTELRAGLTTFFTMAYIISVNAAIISGTGGTCECAHTSQDPLCKEDTEYQLCALDVQRDLVTATAAISALASFLMGLLANLPVAVAPAMGLNAYLAFQVVGPAGTGPVSYKLAMTAVFVEGFIFVFLSLIGLRQWLAKVIPASIKVACGAGIGLFLTLIGLSSGAGIGAISGDVSTPLALAGCDPKYVVAELGPACQSHKATLPTMWIGFLVGGILTAIMMTYKVRGAMIFGIAIVSIMSWPRNSNFTYFPHDGPTGLGESRFQFFKSVVGFRPIKNTLAVQDWNLAGAGGQFALALFTMLYVDILDCTGTLYSMARFSGVVDPDTGDFPRSTVAYCTDAICISIGSLFGTSPVTAFVESGAGIQEGGRTGLTAMTTGLCFLVSVFFAPIFASIPPWATGGALVLVGCMMMKGTLAINWGYPGDAIPAFVTLVFMPFSYSIAYGLIAGITTYILINSTTYLLSLLSRGRIEPDDYDLKEYWSWRSESRGARPWFVRAVRGDKKFWREDGGATSDSFELRSNAEGGSVEREGKGGVGVGVEGRGGLR